MTDTRPTELAETAHVLFVDIVGYTQLPLEQQDAAVSALAGAADDLANELGQEGHERPIRAPSGDGFAVVFFRELEGPAQWAVALHRRVKSRTLRYRLRMGIHSGPVLRGRDVNQQDNVRGDGINQAARVMDAARPGQVLVSAAAAEQLRTLKRWRRRLEPIGSVQVKHNVNIFTYELRCDDRRVSSKDPGGQEVDTRQRHSDSSRGVGYLPKWLRGNGVTVTAGIAVVTVLVAAIVLRVTTLFDPVAQWLDRSPKVVSFPECFKADMEFPSQVTLDEWQRKSLSMTVTNECGRRKTVYVTVQAQSDSVQTDPPALGSDQCPTAASGAPCWGSVSFDPGTHKNSVTPPRLRLVKPLNGRTELSMNWHVVGSDETAIPILSNFARVTIVDEPSAGRRTAVAADTDMPRLALLVRPDR